MGMSLQGSGPCQESVQKENRAKKCLFCKHVGKNKLKKVKKYINVVFTAHSSAPKRLTILMLCSSKATMTLNYDTKVVTWRHPFPARPWDDPLCRSGYKTPRPQTYLSPF